MRSIEELTVSTFSFSAEAVEWSCSPAVPSSARELDDSSTDWESESAAPVMPSIWLRIASIEPAAWRIPSTCSVVVPATSAATSARRPAAASTSFAADATLPTVPRSEAVMRSKERERVPSSSSSSRTSDWLRSPSATRATSRASSRTVSTTSRDTIPETPTASRPPTISTSTEISWRACSSAAVSCSARRAARSAARASAGASRGPEAASSST